MTIPNGWHIKYNPKPIPIRGHDWDFWHDEVDNDSRLCGTAGSEEEAKLAIMEKQAERYGFDKHADKPDDFESHINIESLQQRIDEQAKSIRALKRWKTEAAEVLAQWDAVAELVPVGFRSLGKSKSALVSEHIATLEAACEASARWYKFHKRGFPIATPQAEELMVHYLRAAGYLNTEREE